MMSQCLQTNTSVIAHKLHRSLLIAGRDFDGFHLSLSVIYWSAVSVCERKMALLLFTDGSAGALLMFQRSLSVYNCLVADCLKILH